MAEERDGEGGAMASLVKKIISTAKAPAAMGPYRCAPAGGSGLCPVGGCGAVLGVIRGFWGGFGVGGPVPGGGGAGGVPGPLRGVGLECHRELQPARWAP